MELGLGSYAFRWAVGTSAFRPSRPLTLSGMVEQTADLGCTLLQVADSAELNAQSSPERLRLREHAAGLGIRLQTGTSGLTEERMLVQLDIARDLEADIVRVVLDADGINPSVQESIDILTALAPRYADAGVTIAIENHFLTPSPEIVAIVENVSSASVGVCLDTGNSIMVGEWPMKTIELLAPYAVNLHLKDYAIESDVHGVGGHVVGRRISEGWLDIPQTLGSVAHADSRLAGHLGVIIEQWLPFTGDEQSTLDTERAGREANVARAREALSRRAEAPAGTTKER